MPRRRTSSRTSRSTVSTPVTRRRLGESGQLLPGRLWTTGGPVRTLSAVSLRRYVLTFGVVVLIGLGLVGGGVFLLLQRETGTRTHATVMRCEPHDRYGGGGCV